MTYPHAPNLVVTAEDFRACGWKEALQTNVKELEYPTISQALFSGADNAKEEGRLAHGKVLWLLAAATSMMLQADNLNEPFAPFANFGNRRSTIPDDFAPEDLTLFAVIVAEIDDVLLKTRINDLLWLLARPRPVDYALAAIDGYRSVPLAPDSWNRGCRECWKRAFKLTLSLGKGSGSRLADMQEKVAARIVNATIADKFFPAQLAKLLSENRPSKADAPNIAQKLETLAKEFDRNGDFYTARGYYEEAAEWYSRLKEAEKAAEMLVGHAESLVQEAEFCKSDVAASHLISNLLYEKAIQIYREIPRRQRPLFQVEDRIVRLRGMLGTSGTKALGEMGMFTSPGVNITELVEGARDAVRGKSPVDALVSFATVCLGERVDVLKKGVLERMGELHFQTLFATTCYSRDGRVVARIPPMRVAASDPTAGEDPAVFATMVRYHNMFLSIAVQGSILPALQVLQLEHRLSESDFTNLAKASPIIPYGREHFFGKALHAGYEGDFATALHLLIPQIEHLVRVHLKNAGANTTNLGLDGIENEIGLSSLMDLPEVEKVLGNDLAFEFRALFCSAFGPNLRNEIAHGLLTWEDCCAPPAVYAWWLGCKLVINAWRNTRAEVRQEDEQRASEA